MDRGKDKETKFHLLTRFFNNLNHKFLNLKCNKNNNNNNDDNHNHNQSNIINAQGSLVLYQLIIRYTPPAREMTALFAK